MINKILGPGADDGKGAEDGEGAEMGLLSHLIELRDRLLRMSVSYTHLTLPTSPYV